MARPRKLTRPLMLELQALTIYSCATFPKLKKKKKKKGKKETQG